MERGGRAWGTGVQEAARARLQRFKARWGGRTREQIWNLHEGESILEYEGVSKRRIPIQAGTGQTLRM